MPKREKQDRPFSSIVRFAMAINLLLALLAVLLIFIALEIAQHHHPEDNQNWHLTPDSDPGV